MYYNMTLPKGYVPPNKKAADEKAKQLADEKAIPKINDAKTISTEVLDKTSESQNINNDVNFNTSYPIDYAKIWDEMKKAYIQTVKEATTSYLRLMDFWIKDFKK